MAKRWNRSVPWEKAEAISDRNAAVERKEALEPAPEEEADPYEYDDEGHHPHDMEDGW